MISAGVDQDGARGVAADDDGVVLRIAIDGRHPVCSGGRGRDRQQDAAIQQLEAAEFDQGNASRRPSTALASHEQFNQLELGHGANPPR